MRATAPPHIVIERDSFLADTSMIPLYQTVTGGMLPLRSVSTDITVRIVGERDQPLSKTTVVVYGAGFPAQAITDDAGTARLTLFGGLADAVQAIYVKPPANYWERFIPTPRLDDTGVNTIRLRPMSQTLPNFPTERAVGWGQRVMRLDQPDGSLTGAGVRIGIIDSGCDNSHPQLRHVTRGRDFVNDSETGWTDDVISHGTHCCGVVGAASTGQGIPGFAPGAELHAFKVVPGGRMSDLLAALDECIARELDVVSISVSSTSTSELVSHKLMEARQKGVACVVAAGDAGGPVRFPAMLPSVMAVGAVGKLGEFPNDSYHAQSVIPQLVGSEGIFATAFSCFGPQVALCGPGVAIVSTVPGGGYAAADGTSAAAAHVVGFAGLVLAHHPLFLGLMKTRSEQRVDALFALIRASAVPHFADPLRGGAGLPDLQRVPAQGAPGGIARQAPDPFANLFSFGGIQQPAPYWPSAASGWQALMQMRAAGLF
jgi:subtilisin family serine protease